MGVHSFPKQFRLNPPVPAGIESCPSLVPRSERPTSVHDLRIADDFRVVAALGDSITAGFGAKGIVRGQPISKEHMQEDRGVAFSMGGDCNAWTLANFIRFYQPEVEGLSFGSHFGEFCSGPMCAPYQYHSSDNLNGAQSGAFVMNLSHELDYLIKMMKRSRKIDFQNDFKLLTLFIGSNDACLGCGVLSHYMYLSPDAYELQMRGLLLRIKASIPNVVVNILTQFNVSQVYDLTHNDPYCEMARNTGLVFECTCAFLPEPVGAITRRRMDELVQAYNERLFAIAADFGKLDKNFAVIVDPLLTDVAIKDWSIGLVSNIDCFHPDVKVHEIMASGIWWVGAYLIASCHPSIRLLTSPC
ncbi:hypothetical protein BC832DRAFT_535370 [Gaertneriomyces semiglobifer]|nr:hypothetical protein BC832DRAFT_535370 [Gaertneriomyces semiglobifer]